MGIHNLSSAFPALFFFVWGKGGKCVMHHNAVRRRVWDSSAGRRWVLFSCSPDLMGSALFLDQPIPPLVRMWNTETGAAVGSPLEDPTGVWVVAYSPDERAAYHLRVHRRDHPYISGIPRLMLQSSSYRSILVMLCQLPTLPTGGISSPDLSTKLFESGILGLVMP